MPVFSCLSVPSNLDPPVKHAREPVPAGRVRLPGNIPPKTGYSGPKEPFTKILFTSSHKYSILFDDNKIALHEQIPAEIITCGNLYVSPYARSAYPVQR